MADWRSSENHSFSAGDGVSKALSAYETAMLERAMKKREKEAKRKGIANDIAPSSLRYLFSVFSIFH